MNEAITKTQYGFSKSRSCYISQFPFLIELPRRGLCHVTDNILVDNLPKGRESDCTGKSIFTAAFNPPYSYSARKSLELGHNILIIPSVVFNSLPLVIWMKT